MFLKTENSSSEFEYKYWAEADVMSDIAQYLDRLDETIYYKYESSPVVDSLYVYIDGLTPSDMCVVYNTLFDSDFDSLPTMSESDFYVDYDDDYEIFQDLLLKIWNCGSDFIRLM